MFQSLQALPADPILGLMASYRADNNPRKIDLGIGIYKDEHGNTPVMAAVAVAAVTTAMQTQMVSFIGSGGTHVQVEKSVNLNGTSVEVLAEGE